MTTIRATCPSCGDVRLKASDVVVRVCANDNKGSYCFRCPSCGLRVTKSADSRIVDLLASSGVKMDVWHLPAELWEARPTGAPHGRGDGAAYGLPYLAVGFGRSWNLITFGRSLLPPSWCHGVYPPPTSLNSAWSW